MSDADARNLPLTKIAAAAFAVGALGMLACLAGPWAGSSRFYSSYLFAYVFWIGLSLGCLAVTMLHHLVGGGWGFVTRRFLQAGTGTLPVMLLLSLPVFFGLAALYPWARAEPETLAAPARLWLSRPFFVARAGAYFASWLALSFIVRRWSARLEKEADPGLSHRLRLVCAGGLVVYGVTVFFSSVDWILSLEPGWPSTIYGMIAMAGQGLSALAWVTAVAGALSRRPPLAEAMTPSRLNDLGNLLLMFVMLWAYVGFSQYLIIWSGNLPREIAWVRHRTAPGWNAVALGLIVFHFAVPFLLLLFRRVKRSRVLLPIVAGGLVAVHAVDVFWRVRPSFDQSGLSLQWTDLITPLTLGGFWIGTYALQLRRGPLLSREEAAHA